MLLTEYDKPVTACEFWRFGFNHAEKHIILRAAKLLVDDERCVRKDILKLLKRDVTEVASKRKLLEVCSYFAKTTMLHLYERIPDINDWIIKPRDRAVLHLRYVDALNFLIDAIQTRNLPHYFIPQSNLFDKAIMSDKGCQELDVLMDYLIKRRDELNRKPD